IASAAEREDRSCHRCSPSLSHLSTLSETLRMSEGLSEQHEEESEREAEPRARGDGTVWGVQWSERGGVVWHHGPHVRVALTLGLLPFVSHHRSSLPASHLRLCDSPFTARTT